MKRIIFACVAALAATGAATSPMADLIGSKTYWQAMVWENAEQSEIWNLSGWNPFEGMQEAGRTFTKERPADIDGKNLRAYLIVEETPKRRSVLSINSIELSADECEQIGYWLVRKFGQPKLVVDGSYKFDLIAEGNTVENIEKISQWDIGSTRVTFTCAGLKKAFASILTFGSKASEREIKPLFGLRCTQRVETLGIDAVPKDGDDIVFIIDENRKNVRSANKNPLSGEHRITEDVIEVKTMRGGTTIEFSINRLTGAFKGKSLVARGGINISGRCEKTEAGERKF